MENRNWKLVKIDQFLISTFYTIFLVSISPSSIFLLFIMLPKPYRLFKDKEFAHVFRQGFQIETDLLVARAIKNNLALVRFGFIVSRRISNKATQRNLIKRRLSEAIRAQMPIIKSGYDIVIIAKAGIVGKGFGEIEEEVGRLLEKAGILENF